MPEAFVIAQQILPEITVNSGEGEDGDEGTLASGSAKKKEPESKLGFRITGGVDFNMPITIFHVAEDSRADKAGLKLGDSIHSINGQETSKMTLAEANVILEAQSQQDVKLGVTKFDDEDLENPGKTPKIHEVLLEGKRKPHDPYEKEMRPPQNAFIQPAERKAWHPVMWQQVEPAQKIREEMGEDRPHKRIIRNLRRLLADVKNNPAEREKHIENILLALPRGSRPQRTNDDDD